MRASHARNVDCRFHLVEHALQIGARDRPNDGGAFVANDVGQFRLISPGNAPKSAAALRVAERFVREDRLCDLLRVHNSSVGRTCLSSAGRGVASSPLPEAAFRGARAERIPASGRPVDPTDNLRMWRPAMMRASQSSTERL